MEKIRYQLIINLKKSENETVKNFIINSVMNNEAIKTDLNKILDKLEDRFGVSDETKQKIAFSEFHNFKYSGSTSDILDRMEILRRRLFKTMKIDTENESLTMGVFDKMILTDWLEKMKEMGKFQGDEYRKLKEDFKTNKNNWEKCRKLIRSEVRERKI